MLTKRINIVLPVVLVVLLVTACASSGGKTDLADGADDGKCSPRAADSVYAGATPAYRECAVKTKAQMLQTGVRPDFAPSSGGKSCYSAEIEFVVDEKGFVETRTARVVRTNDHEFAASMINALPQRRFEPAKLNGVPVRQITSSKQTAQVMKVVVASGSSPSAARAAARGSAPKC